MQNVDLLLDESFVTNMQPFLIWMCKAFDMEAKPILEQLEQVETYDDAEAIFDIIYDSRQAMLGTIDNMFCGPLFDDDTDKICGLEMVFEDADFSFAVECGNEGLIFNANGLAMAEMLHSHAFIQRDLLVALLPLASQSMLSWMLRVIDSMPLPESAQSSKIRDLARLEIKRFLMPETARMAKGIGQQLLTCCEVLDSIFASGVALQTAMAELLQGDDKVVTSKAIRAVFKSLCIDSGVLTLNFEYDAESRRVNEIVFWLNLPGYDYVELVAFEDAVSICGEFFQLDFVEGLLFSHQDLIAGLVSRDRVQEDSFRHAMTGLLNTLKPWWPKDVAERQRREALMLLRNRATLVTV